jgi:hypothetical protein
MKSESQSLLDDEAVLNRFSIFLGGYDLETVEISKLLATCKEIVVHDHHLAWGAKASTYSSEIEAALNEARRVVLVELVDDLAPEIPRENIVFVDHHGPLAGQDRPTSIEQVFSLVGFPPERWTRDLMLVAANDRGHIAGLRRAGATLEEIREIRARDRRAQGISEEQEKAGIDAARRAERRLEGRLTVIRLPHDKSATVTDPLDTELGGPGFRNLLVLCPVQTLFFGEGQGIDALRERFPGGWYGGELPTRGYWGIAKSVPEQLLLDALEVALDDQAID